LKKSLSGRAFKNSKCKARKKFKVIEQLSCAAYEYKFFEATPQLDDFQRPANLPLYPRTPMLN
jgi:hypothetical protein